MDRIISIDLKSNLGFFKNPQFNGEKESKYYGFDSIHKNAILGIFGSLLGLRGISDIKNKVFPEYYEKLSHLKIGIKLLNPEIKKEWFQINSSSGMFSKQEGGNLLLNYQILCNPEYRIFLLIDDDNPLEKKLYSILKDDLIGHFGDICFGKSVYVAERDNFQEYSYSKIEFHEGIIETLFKGEYNLKVNRFDKNSNEYNLGFLFGNNEQVKYERFIDLPSSLEEYNNKVRYSRYEQFVHTNKEIHIKNNNLYQIDNDVIYLF